MSNNEEEKSRRYKVGVLSGIGGGIAGEYLGKNVGKAAHLGSTSLGRKSLKHSIKNPSTLVGTKIPSFKELRTQEKILKRTPSLVLGGKKSKQELLDLVNAVKGYKKHKFKYQSVGSLLGALAAWKVTFPEGGSVPYTTKQASRTPVSGGRSYNRKDQVAQVNTRVPSPQESGSPPVVSRKAMKSFTSKRAETMPGSLLSIGLGKNPAKTLAKQPVVKTDRKGNIKKVASILNFEIERISYGVSTS